MMVFPIPKGVPLWIVAYSLIEHPVAYYHLRIFPLVLQMLRLLSYYDTVVDFAVFPDLDPSLYADPCTQLGASAYSDTSLQQAKGTYLNAFL